MDSSADFENVCENPNIFSEIPENVNQMGATESTNNSISGGRTRKKPVQIVASSGNSSASSSTRSSPVAGKGDKLPGAVNNVEDNLENFSLSFRENIPKVSRARPMRKGDLVANYDCQIQEPHKMPLFAVDIAPYVLPPISGEEVAMGTQEEREALKENLARETKRIRALKSLCASKKHLNQWDMYPSDYQQVLTDEAKKRLDKGKKQREVFGQYPQYLVATSGGKNVCIYVTTEAPGSKLLLRNVFEDVDGDEFYSIKFTRIRSKRKDGSEHDYKVLVCAGLHGTLRVLNVRQGKSLYAIESAAGQGINEIAVHPKLPEIVACVSKDLTVRVWNIFSSVQVLLLTSAALYGHVSEILTLDWSPDKGNKLVTSGMDNSLVLWDISDQKYKDALEYSYVYKEEASASMKRRYDNHRKPQLPLQVCFPQLVNKSIHKNYVDSVKFLTKDIIISKSSENYIAAWTDQTTRTEDNTVKSLCSILFQYELTASKIWFMKLALQPKTRRLLALGLQDGRIMVMDLKSDPDPQKFRINFLRATGNVAISAIRHVAFSPDSRVLIGVTQDAKVVKFSLNGAAIIDKRIKFGIYPIIALNEEAFEDFLSSGTDKSNTASSSDFEKNKSEPVAMSENANLAEQNDKYELVPIEAILGDESELCSTDENVSMEVDIPTAVI